MFEDRWREFLLEDEELEEANREFRTKTSGLSYTVGDVRKAYDTDFTQQRRETGLQVKKAWREEADMEFFLNDIAYVHICGFKQAISLFKSLNNRNEISAGMYLKQGDGQLGLVGNIPLDFYSEKVAVVLSGVPTLAVSDMDKVYSGNYREKCPYGATSEECKGIQKFPAFFDDSTSDLYITNEQEFVDLIGAGTEQSEALLTNWKIQAVLMSQDAGVNSIDGEITELSPEIYVDGPNVLKLLDLCAAERVPLFTTDFDTGQYYNLVDYEELLIQELGEDEAEQEEEDLYGSLEDDSLDENLIHSIDSLLNEKKDACYHKVKSRYKKWPSAYASGALVKCRKVGAKNWGNSVKEYKEKILGGLSPHKGSMKDVHQQIAEKHKVSVEQIEKQISKGISIEKEHTTSDKIAHEIAMDHVWEDPKYYDKLEKIEEAKKKAGTESGKEKNLRDWFKRKGAKGKTGGWVDCNTCRDGKCKPCGRQEGESRAKYPACRPTPSACKEKGRGKTWGKKSKKIGK